MFVVRLAEFNIGIDCIYEYTRNMCAEYITDSAADFTVSVTDADIDREDDGGGFARGYLESLAVYRKIAEKLLERDGFLMHGVVAEANGEGIAFLARSGTGKTTHAAFWQECFGDRFTVINGDKPLIRIKDGMVYAYGTPWAGKEGLNKNARTHLRKICFIERADTDCLTKPDTRDVLTRLCAQIYMPADGAQKLKTFELIDLLMRGCEFFVIHCTKNPEAAQVAAAELGIFDK